MTLKHVPPNFTSDTPGALNAALDLASRGLPCFPCANSKRPTCPRGFHDATCNPKRLRALWRQHPGELVGVPTGEGSNLLVLDIDAKHPEARLWWIENRDGLPTTRAHRTRSGGLHLLFRHVAGLKCSAGKLAPGIDIRAEGGFIVWWPAAGMPVLSEEPVGELPIWLYRLLLLPPPPPPRPATRVALHSGDRRGLRGVIRAVATAAEGERNNVTFWGACRLGEMVFDGTLSEANALDLIVEAAARNGISRDEALRTARSGLRAARG